jgi:hypothetical protein
MQIEINNDLQIVFVFCYLINHIGSAETPTTGQMILSGTDSRLADNKNVDPNEQKFNFIG